MNDAATNHRLAEEAERLALAWFAAGSCQRRLVLEVAKRLRDDAVEIARLRNLDCQARAAART